MDDFGRKNLYFFSQIVLAAILVYHSQNTNMADPANRLLLGTWL